MKVKWLFFDIGSTLIDETDVYERRIGRIAELAGISKESASEKVLELYKQNKKGDLELARKYDVELPKWESEYEVPYREAEEVLRKLHDKYKIGIIANQNPGTRERLESWGLLKYIDMVVASAEEGVAKPDRRIFDIALERAGVAPEDAFMIGDRIDNDILPAKNIGMKTIWVQQGFGGLWVIKNDSEVFEYTFGGIPEATGTADFDMRIGGVAPAESPFSSAKLTSKPVNTTFSSAVIQVLPDSNSSTHLTNGISSASPSLNLVVNKYS